mmetsp:Transcript_6249/g.15401  ORF Transcript_6249/g.15401 Transcript_6249/m.15401 type:complete len:82 (+) Transcript_6249:63-308(+)|eukprot:CAMPEP_0113867538 /NCGR_PEP_ID=MMETSP0780_2-20120614/477_1 /TAXON_ID=652834 /ORGANISM="Palpitomonas bilix" /LENGTH=81 /DNA_ID=CAMNT_0000852497 /DNA_START=47 /DNA_END=292 /DNA_ORIENTATION=+ /assembly_acc=CAM_ASM_000599
MPKGNTRRESKEFEEDYRERGLLASGAASATLFPQVVAGGREGSTSLAKSLFDTNYEGENMNVVLYTEILKAENAIVLLYF